MPLDVARAASGTSHKVNLSHLTADGELPFIHPGQLTVFDLLSGSDGVAN